MADRKLTTNVLETPRPHIFEGFVRASELARPPENCEPDDIFADFGKGSADGYLLPIDNVQRRVAEGKSKTSNDKHLMMLLPHMTDKVKHSYLI